MSRDRPTIAVRPPPRVADAFVSGQRPASDAQPSVEPPSAPPSGEQLAASREPPAAGRRRRGIVARADGAEVARLTVYVRVGDAAKLRRYCFDRDLDLSEVAAEAIAEKVAGLQE